MNEYSGSFEMVDPKAIVVDHRYQRPEKPALIARISSNPDWEAFGVIVCYKRGELYYCIDGQQRLAGILRTQEIPKRVPVVWFPPTSIEHEASTFVRVNVDRKAVEPLEKYRGQLVAKDPVALAIERAVDRAGFTIDQGRDSARSIAAVGALHYVYNQLGEDGVVQVLVQCREAWPDDKTAIGVNILRGLGDVFASMNGNYNRQKLTTSLAKTSPALILRKAEELRFDLGGSKQTNVRRAFKALAKV